MKTCIEHKLVSINEICSECLVQNPRCYLIVISEVILRMIEFRGLENALQTLFTYLLAEDPAYIKTHQPEYILALKHNFPEYYERYQKLLLLR